MARYEFRDAKSAKFWQIDLDGTTFTVRYGKIGTDGMAKTKVFDSADKALKEHDKMVRSKTKKGYALVAAAAVAPGGGTNQALESAILDDPNDQDSWLVYGDWLQSSDDPRGALLAAQAGGGDGADLIEANKKAFLGRFAGNLEPYVEFTWKNGFWRTAKVLCDYDSAEDMPEDTATIASVLGRVLRHDSARFLYALNIGLTEGHVDGEAEWQGCIDAVVSNGIRKSVRELFVGDFERVDETEISWTDIGNLGKLWTVLPNLEKLTVQGGGIGLGTISAPKLQSMRIWTGGLGPEVPKSIGDASLPALTRLEVWLGTEDYNGSCSAADLAGILAGTGLPAVSWLGLMNADFANDLPAVIAASAILPRLEHLDLSMGTMTDEGAKIIIENAARFKHLKSLNLDENFISADVAAALWRKIPTANIGTQEDATDWVYVSVGE
jgi:uncharacterized protein (TIGR02996 family)